MANTRNKVAIVFDGVVCLEKPSQSALPPTALPKGEPRVSHTNCRVVCRGGNLPPVGVNRAVGMTALGHPWLLHDGFNSAFCILNSALLSPAYPACAVGFYRGFHRHIRPGLRRP
ncbi:MAG: hypothetical protein FWH14_08485 [Oscillospiraceae bacterium]|nr:hypothetical protein [Oscillospiraceae bacterium]